MNKLIEIDGVKYFRTYASVFFSAYYIKRDMARLKTFSPFVSGSGPRTRRCTNFIKNDTPFAFKQASIYLRCGSIA